MKKPPRKAWDYACAEANIVSGHRVRNHFSDKEMIGWIQSAARGVGHSPTGSEYADWAATQKTRSGSSPSKSTLIRRFGSWGEALESAGLDPIPAPKEWDNDEIIDAVVRWDKDRDLLRPATRSGYGKWRSEQKLSLIHI